MGFALRVLMNKAAFHEVEHQTVLMGPVTLATNRYSLIAVRIAQKTVAGSDVVGGSGAPVSWTKTTWPVVIRTACNQTFCAIRARMARSINL